MNIIQVPIGASRNGKRPPFLKDMKYHCEQCGKTFRRKNNYLGRIPKFCSRICASIRLRKIKKCIGCGKKFYYWGNDYACSRLCWAKHQRGSPLSKEHRAALKVPKPNAQNEKHKNWKGDRAGYGSIHSWINRHYGKADRCENKINRAKKHFHARVYYWALLHDEEHGHYVNTKLGSEKDVIDLDRMQFADRLDVWFEARDKSKDYEHPTQKPVSLIERAIKKSCIPDGKVLDLFGGGGSTLVAAEITGRTAYLMELDPAYCDVIRKRYKQFETP